MAGKKQSAEKRRLVEELHAPARRNLSRRRVIVRGYDDLWQADVVEMRPYTRFHRGYHYILTVIDVLSKHAWAVPLKTKSGPEVTTAIAKIIRDGGRCPKNLQTDKGKEFYNTNVQKLLKKHNINHYSTYSTTEVFRIVKVQKTNPVTYLMEDSCEKPVAGGFYEYELHRVANPDVYLVEKVLRKRGNEFFSFDKPRYTPRILGRRFALTSTAYKFLDVGISAGPLSSVDILIGDNRGNRIILPHATWVTFIENHADIQRLVQSSAPSSLTFRDLELVKIRNADIVKLTSCGPSLYMKPSTVLFLFELEHCVENVYFQLCQNVHGVSEKFKQFVTTLRQNCITDKCNAVTILRKIYDKNSIIDCELLAYALDTIVYNALHDK
ncbi:uncharacterized protein LOC143908795 [Temnothorax americanus]|uniref:uncharacterized protein LOC143908795 n=1 Tax=Temnothorax americanus TaxID=1964332 RepID=UPI004068BF36